MVAGLGELESCGGSSVHIVMGPCQYFQYHTHMFKLKGF